MSGVPRNREHRASTRILTVLAGPEAAVTAATASAVLADHEEVVVEIDLPNRPVRPPGRFDDDEFSTPDIMVSVDSASTDSVARLTARLGVVVDDVAPDVVIVHGEGPGALAAVLATSSRRPALVVAEAGLRTEPRTERGRLGPDHVSDLALAPTPHAVATLRSEGRTRGVVAVGDLRESTIASAGENCSESAAAEMHDRSTEEYVLLAPRAPGGLVQTDEFRRVLRGATAGPLPVVVPGLRPLVATLAAKGLLDVVRQNCRLVEPRGYGVFLHRLAHAAGVLTDDPDVQREAYHLRTPCVTLAGVTPWPDAVDAGWNVLAGTDPTAIRAAVTRCRMRSASRPRELDGDRTDARFRAAIEAAADCVLSGDRAV